MDPHNKINRMGLEELRSVVWACLTQHSGTSMTFNELSVRLFDLTADVTSGTSLEDALWSLVGDGCVALTYEAPIQWCRTCDLQGVQDTAPRYEAQPRLEAEPEVLERGLEFRRDVGVEPTPEPALSELPLFASMEK